MGDLNLCHPLLSLYLTCFASSFIAYSNIVGSEAGNSDSEDMYADRMLDLARSGYREPRRVFKTRLSMTGASLVDQWGEPSYSFFSVSKALSPRAKEPAGGRFRLICSCAESSEPMSDIFIRRRFGH
jgi:hypothetical protein